MTSLTIFFMAAAVGFGQPDISAEFSTDIPVNGLSNIVKNMEIFGRAKWEAAEENSSGRLQKNEQSLDVELKSYLNDNLSLKAIVRALHENKLQQESLSDIDLREFYLEFFGESAKVRLGRQQVVWGKTDGLRLLDLINPQDFREFILNDFIDSRIPLWMARTDLYIGDNTLQLLVIPDVEFSRIPGPGDRFEPLFLKTVRAVPLPHLDEGEPATKLSNSEVGLRFSGFAKGWDYTLNYLYAWEDNPLFYNETVGGIPSIVRRYRRLSTLGGSFSTAFGGFVFRGETALNLDKFFAAADVANPDGQVEKNELKAALGLDYTHGDWFLSGQIFESVIGNYESGLVSDEYTTLLSLLVTANFINETLEIRLLNIFGINESDNLARLSATYDISDKWKLMGGVSVFSGPEDSFLGQFGDADRFEAELTYSF